MRVSVKLIGGLIHLVGFAEEEVHLPAETTAGALLAGLGIDRPDWVIVTRNGRGIGLDEPVEEGDHILISPPFSGG